jgi:carboxypeptidase Taq
MLYVMLQFEEILLAESLITDYNKLMEKSKDLFILQSVASLVNWDMETMMPPKGIRLRSMQLAMLGGIEHKISTDPKIGKLLTQILQHTDYGTLDELQKRNVYLMKKHYDEQTKLPEELVIETAKQQAITVDKWKKAKKAKDYSIFKPDLEKLLNLRKKAARILMDVKKTATPYDALIDIFEPKMTATTIDKVFQELREGLISLLKKIENAQKKPEMSILGRKIPIDIQRKIATSLAETIGYDVTSKNAGGRIDETEHPFTTGYYDDIRITTHYYEENFASSIFSTLHEGGHALYEQGLNQKWIFQPIGSGCSSGFHESQSRFMENIIGRSREFWIYFLPKLKEFTGSMLSQVNLDSFVRAINAVKPSKIRVEADEVTYCLHIIIRFNIEKALFADDITVNELPQVWNQMYKDYLGIEIENDSEGVMQDTHWASGAFGYFPSYALGNIYSGQMLFSMEKEIHDWKNQISSGNFQNVKQWLVDKVHRHGNLYDPSELLKRITSQELRVKPYLDYLNNKYSGIYDF